jgi:hypothetical protein
VGSNVKFAAQQAEDVERANQGMVGPRSVAIMETIILTLAMQNVSVRLARHACKIGRGMLRVPATDEVGHLDTGIPNEAQLAMAASRAHPVSK